MTVESSYEPGIDPEFWECLLHCVNPAKNENKAFKMAIKADTSNNYTMTSIYGPIGGTMMPGKGLKEPSSYAAARKMALSVLKEKIKKGYKVVSVQHGDTAAACTIDDFVRPEDSGIQLQMLADASPEVIDAALRSHNYFVQEKYNGHRRAIVYENGEAYGVKKTGIKIGLPSHIKSIVETGLEGKGRTVIDGELVGRIYYAFDLIEFDGTDLREVAAENRQELLGKECLKIISRNSEARSHQTTESGCFLAAETAYPISLKLEMVNRIRAKNGEGYVLKKRDSFYGKERGENQIRCKFWQSLSAIVSGINDRASVQMSLYDEAGNLVSIGNVSLGSFKVNEGDVIEVKYQHCRECLISPAIIEIRDDKPQSECMTDQLVYDPQYIRTQAA